ncbi:MAG: methyltransferase domain-containing protein [Planctomycetota bacterium]
MTTLVRCGTCRLLFRAPTTTAASNRALYRGRYTAGFTTDLPAPATLAAWVAAEFRGSPKDYSKIIELLAAANAPADARLFDLGCSWGYGSWQLARAGFDVEAFEVDPRRAAFAREHLGVRVFDAFAAARGPYDVFFSSHVLEHLPELGATLTRAFEVLRPGGLFVAFTPNGCEARRRRAPEAWHRAWGEVHPNLLDEHYYRARFGDPFLSTSPHDPARVAAWARGDATPDDPLDGDELLVLTRKPVGA